MRSLRRWCVLISPIDLLCECAGGTGTTRSAPSLADGAGTSVIAIPGALGCLEVQRELREDGVKIIRRILLRTERRHHSAGSVRAGSGRASPRKFGSESRISRIICRNHHHEVRLREVIAVVVSLFLARIEIAAPRAASQGFWTARPPSSSSRVCRWISKLERALHVPERVHVLDLGFGSEGTLPLFRIETFASHRKLPPPCSHRRCRDK